MLYAARREKGSPGFVLAIQESKGERECRRKGQLGRKTLAFTSQVAVKLWGKCKRLEKIRVFLHYRDRAKF